MSKLKLDLNSMKARNVPKAAEMHVDGTEAWFRVARELITQSGIRAVSAWIAAREHGNESYSTEVAYELREQVGDDIGYDHMHEVVDPAYDTEPFSRYAELFEEYGEDLWPTKALTQYFEHEKTPEAELKAEVVWNFAMARYTECKYAQRVAQLARSHLSRKATPAKEHARS